MGGSKWGLDFSFFRTFFLMHLPPVLLLDGAVGWCDRSLKAVCNRFLFLQCSPCTIGSDPLILEFYRHLSIPFPSSVLAHTRLVWWFRNLNSSTKVSYPL
jgi:hypothetical protein